MHARSLRFVLVFLVSHAQAAKGKLEWQAPTHNTDGTLLTELAGYTIYYWQPGWDVPLNIEIGNQTVFTLTDLDVGKTYYFSVTAVSASGKESAFADNIHTVIAIDTDGDGLTDEEERSLYGTNPALADTDGDGLRDRDEVALWGVAWSHDADGDGLRNLLDADADNDGINDAQEFLLDSDPADPTSKPSIVALWLEAETGQLQAPIHVASKTVATAGQYVWVPPGSAWIQDPQDAGGSVRYRFHVPQAGTYVVWGRVMANSITEDSFYIVLDAGPFMPWHIRSCGPRNWCWDVISDRHHLAPRDASTPFLFALEAGEHSLVVHQREAGSKLDQLLITNDLTLMPSSTGQAQ